MNPPWRRRRAQLSSRSILSEYEEVLSLDHVRERLGDKWPQCQQNIYKVATKIIERYKNGPINVRRNKEYFCLNFRCSSREVARQQTLKIAAVIDGAIFGNLQAFEAGATANRLSVGQTGSRSSGWGLGRLVKKFASWLIKRDVPELPSAMQARGGANAPAVMLARVALTARAADESHHQIGNASSVGSGAEPTRAVRRMTESEPHTAPVAGIPHVAIGSSSQNAASPPNNPATDRLPETPILEGGLKVGQTSPDEITGIEALLTLEGARLALEQENLTRAAQFPPNDLQFVHRPIWSIRTSMLGLSTCFPACIRNGTELCVGYGVLPPKYEQENVSFLDELVLRRVVEQCRVFQEAGRPPLIIVPVHYENLSDPDRLARYRAVCDEIPTAARRFLSFELWGIGEAYGHHQVVSILSTLRRYSGAQFGNLSCGQANLTFWKTAGLHGIGVNIDEWSGQFDGEKELIEALERFRLCAYRTGLRSYARGIPSRSIALACVAAGYDFLDGTVIQRSLEPATVVRYALQDLYGLAFA